MDYGSRDFRAVRIGLPGGASKVGMALHQLTGNTGLVVNGQVLGPLLGLGFPVGPDRNGLLIITALEPRTRDIIQPADGRCRGHRRNRRAACQELSRSTYTAP